MIPPGRPLQVDDVLRVSAAHERTNALLVTIEARASLPIAIRMLDAEIGGSAPEDDGGLVDYSIPEEPATSAVTGETC